MEPHIGGVAVDLAKAFDSVPIDITFRILELIGMDAKLLRAIRGIYAQLHRRFKIGRYVGQAFKSTNGILQGCPLSVMLLNAIMAILSRVLQAGLTRESFVDDITLLGLTDEELQAALEVLEQFMDLTGQTVNAKKTFAFGWAGNRT